ncbi:MAG: hypothetical protein HON53_21800 [Planctomycetaceae bacterium]|nr:hypothetical protein [Planctomycetaceae bacterium]MBT6154283.1 hypothetical protein [Planctomycetaceae bacterium]MBT6485583.1 hypothetical protein [Planctomycetaceae bacterium]MBT6495333.1 hypothetical protein [Planctomycetaceae bacterium]
MERFAGMLDTYKEMISQQFEATFCMLGACINRCPETSWNAPVANLQFCQVTFHTLFCADIYLGSNPASLRQQPFHREHAHVFADYEELGDGLQQATYDKSFINTYLQHCRQKASQVLAAESTETLQQMADFEWLNFSRTELHVYNIRHIHHHAAQLSLRLRLDADIEIPWVGSGWRDV